MFCYNLIDKFIAIIKILPIQYNALKLIYKQKHCLNIHMIKFKCNWEQRIFGISCVKINFTLPDQYLLISYCVIIYTSEIKCYLTKMFSLKLNDFQKLYSHIQTNILFYVYMYNVYVL